MRKALNVLSVILCTAELNAKFQLSTHLCGFPKYEKERSSCVSSGVTRKYGGDSAWFDKHAVIIADGVGSWNRKGVDPGFYSKALVMYIGDEFNNADSDSTDLVRVSEKKI